MILNLWNLSASISSATELTRIFNLSSNSPAYYNLWLMFNGIWMIQLGLIRSTLSFMFGTRIYITQNHNVPHIIKLAESSLSMAKHVEETYRKPSEKKDKTLLID
ncbi:hypothetical protein Peur_011012 [Populus x canadensis]